MNSRAISTVYCGCIIVFLLCFGLLFGQEQSTVSPWRTIYLTDLLPAQWDAANFDLATLVGNGNQLYLLLVPKNGKDVHPLLVIASEDGVTETVEELPPHIEPVLGVDAQGTATILARLTSGPSVLKYSANGNLIQTRDIAPTRAAVQAYKQSLRKARRTTTNAINASLTPAVEEISNIVPSATDPYIEATLSNGKTARLHLANSQLTVIDPDKNMSTTTLAIDQNTLRQFGTHLKNGPNVIYPDFLSLAVSPRGGLWGLVSGVKLASGAVAVQINPETAQVAKAVRFSLPQRSEYRNKDNPDGYLPPAHLAICDDNAVLAGGNVVTLAIYKTQF